MIVTNNNPSLSFHKVTFPGKFYAENECIKTLIISNISFKKNEAVGK
jgi:hypothetical protein